MSDWWGFFVEKRIVVNLFKRMIRACDFRKKWNTREELLAGTILRNEDEVVEYLSGWFTVLNYSVFTKSGFSVKNGHGRPDMIIINEKKEEASAVEIKPSKSSEVFKGCKIIDYAKDFCNGAKYIINNSEILIRNFLVATELSPWGRLIEDDVPLNEKRKEKQSEFHKKFYYIEPYFEYQRTADFVRNNIWKQWKKEDRIGMEGINIGILLSTMNDFVQLMLDFIPLPKMFVMHHSKKSGKWIQWWVEI